MFNLILDRCCKVLEAAIAFCLALMVVLVFGNVASPCLKSCRVGLSCG
jgi:TRAP-type C4-dicarboxylate transport system permease small subunit